MCLLPLGRPFLVLSQRTAGPPAFKGRRRIPDPIRTRGRGSSPTLGPNVCVEGGPSAPVIIHHNEPLDLLCILGKVPLNSKTVLAPGSHHTDADSRETGRLGDPTHTTQIW